MSTQLSQYKPTQVVREGSPWTGLWAVVAKEMADLLSSMRMLILEVLIFLTAIGTVYVASENMSTKPEQTEFLFLRLFTTAREPLPAFAAFLGFLVPILAIVLAFDTVNGEFNQRTLSRILAQPIYRDALLFGKFLAGLFTLTLVLTAIWLLIMGLGIFRLGIAPSGEEVARILLYLVLTIFYGGVWMSLAMVFSITFRQPATAMLASIAVWLFFMIFWSIIARIMLNFIYPAQQITSPQGLVDYFQVELMLYRISPHTLYLESMIFLLNPSIRTLNQGIVFSISYQESIPGASLPLSQSILLMWPHLTGLIAVTLLLFVLGYILFQRQEIRA